jgi:predicted O-methyltransferase YrrM
MNWIKENVKSYLSKSIAPNGKLRLTISNPSELDLKVLNLSPGGWSIDRPVSEALMSLVEEMKISRVVEVGAGFSSVVFHYALAQISSSYQVYSIEENVDWFKVPNELENIVDRKTMKFQTGTIEFVLGFFGIHASYKIPERKYLKSGVELVFVDGPQYYYGREGGLDDIYNKLKVGCLIIMDDADRYTEHCVIYKWLKVYKGLELIYLNKKFGDKGFAILRVSEPLTRRFSIDVFSLGMMQGIRRLSNFKMIKQKQEALKSYTTN